MSPTQGSLVLSWADFFACGNSWSYVEGMAIFIDEFD